MLCNMTSTNEKRFGWYADMLTANVLLAAELLHSYNEQNNISLNVFVKM